MKVTINCPDCDASCVITHSMDDREYSVDYCPFCSATMYDNDDYHEEIDLDPDDDGDYWE